jgi:ssDNA thymidine ADP-ribosyltransferase, DarT
MNLSEFQNIALIDNIPSVLKHGILSYVEAAKVPHHSVALETVQEKRDVKRVPGGLALHEYANVYFHARNPMMSRRRNEAHRLCVLRVSPEILNVPGAVIADQNAASKYVRFLAPDRLQYLNLEYVFARNWKHPGDQIEEWRHSSAKCAEVLIPQRIPTEFLTGAYVLNGAARTQLEGHGFELPIQIDSDIFFH